MELYHALTQEIFNAAESPILSFLHQNRTIASCVRPPSILQHNPVLPRHSRAMRAKCPLSLHKSLSQVLQWSFSNLIWLLLDLLVPLLFLHPKKAHHLPEFFLFSKQYPTGTSTALVHSVTGIPYNMFDTMPLLTLGCCKRSLQYAQHKH